jgi:RHS repeat-associated protein
MACRRDGDRRGLSVRARAWLLVSLVLLVYATAGGCRHESQAPIVTGSAVEVICGHAALKRICRDAKLQLADHRYTLEHSAPVSLLASAPDDAVGAIRLESAAGSGVWIELEPIGRTAADGRADRGTVTYTQAEHHADVVVALLPDELEDLRVLWSKEADPSSRYRVRLGPDVESIEAAPFGIQVIDRRGRIAMRTLPPFALDAVGNRHAVGMRIAPTSEGTVLEIRADLGDASYPVVIDPNWVYGPGWPDRAAVALNSIAVGQGAGIGDGLVVIDDAKSPVLADGVELSIGPFSEVGGKSAADGVRMHPNTIVQDLSYNALKNDGGTIFSETKTLSLPVPITVPAFPSFLSSGQNVLVASGTKQSLGAGHYGVVELKDGGNPLTELVLTSESVYTFDKLIVGNKARVLCKNTCDIRVKGTITTGSNSAIRPGDDPPYPYIKDIWVFVEGVGAAGEHVTIGSNNDIDVRLFAPKGTVSLGEESFWTGKIAAFNVKVGSKAQLSSDAGESGPNCTPYCLGLINAKVNCGVAAPTQQQCESECQGKLTAGYCQFQMRKLISCANNFGNNFSCAGIPNGCSAQATHLDMCLKTCVGVDDQDACTQDFCDCTPEDCGANSVKHLVQGVKDDGNKCTIEACDPQLGKYVSTPLAPGASCDDATLCNGHETCDANAACQPGVPPVVDDGNACTSDFCNPMTGVVTHGDMPLGAPCDNGDACDADGLATCDGKGKCIDGVPLKVDDGNPCTVDICDKKLGVLRFSAPKETDCDDGDACTKGDHCDGSGKCVSGSSDLTEDGDPCTLDICDPATGKLTKASCSKLDRSVPTSLFDATKFLLDGGVQNGVTAGAIDPLRAAVIRGRVLSPSLKPLAGVTISVVPINPAHKGFGTTLSQANGWFDLMVNGGGPVTVRYQKKGYPIVQRTVPTEPGDYAIADDVVLTPYDDKVTTVYPGPISAPQVVVGSKVTDGNGSRTPVLIFAAGTEAKMVLANDTKEAAKTLSLRITEFTVGDGGRRAMPDELPPTSVYTYALEVSADEAIEKGAKTIELSKPAALYLDNYRGFPVSTLIPLGFYHRDRALWEPEPDGIVLQIVGVDNGLAQLDFDGDDKPDGGALFEELGITDPERAFLAAKYYDPNKPKPTLWRVALTHLSPFDCNLGGGDDGECAPGDKGCELAAARGASKSPNPSCAAGSVIECKNQTLGQVFPVVGSPYSLTYKSDRAPGHLKAYQLTIPTVGPGVDVNAKKIRYVRTEVQVAGQRFPKQPDDPIGWFDCSNVNNMAPQCQPGAVHEFKLWDGTDGYGRFAQGPQNATVRVGYTSVRSWNLQKPGCIIGNLVNPCPGGGGGSGGSGKSFQKMQLAPKPGGSSGLRTFGSYPSEDIDFFKPLPKATPNPDVLTSYSTVWKRSRVALGVYDSRPEGLAGLGLSVHHAYSSWGKTLFLGDGRFRSATELPAIVQTVAGGGPGKPIGGDGKLATLEALGAAQHMAVAPDGTIYFIDSTHLRKVAPNGILSTVVTFPSGIGDVALGSDGSLYLTEGGFIKRIGPDGLLQNIAGSSKNENEGDGGPAKEASLFAPTRLHVAGDGSVLVVCGTRVRRISPAGIITTVAGGCGQNCKSPNNAPYATQIDFSTPNTLTALTTDPQGRLLIAFSIQKPRVMRVGIDGIVEIIAGNGVAGDGNPAIDASLSEIHDIEVASDGAIYLVVADIDPSNQTESGVRRITSDGIIDTVFGVPAGSCGSKYCGEGGPAAKARFPDLRSMAFGPDGAIYMTTGIAGASVVRIRPPMPPASLSDLVVPDESGSLVYVFDSTGRHKETRDALLGTVRLTFSYAADGRLTKVTDSDGMVTSFALDANGNVTITAPHGQKTILATQGEGFVTKVTDPLGNAYSLGYVTPQNGLLASLTDPKGNEKKYEYDADGLLTIAYAPSSFGGFKSLGRKENVQLQSRQVSLTSALGRTTLYERASVNDNDQAMLVAGPNAIVSRTKGPDGLSVVRRESFDGTTDINHPDNTTLKVENQADPRWGLMAPIAAASTLTTGGKKLAVAHKRTVVLADPNQPLSLQKLADEVTVNGRLATTTFDLTASPKKVTRTTQFGRTSTTEIDAAGRPTKVTPGSAALAPTSLSYYDDAAKKGLLKSVSRGIGANERLYQFFYDTAGSIEHIEGPLGKKVYFQYDAAGRLTQKTLPSSDKVSFFYDKNDNLIRLVPPGADPNGDPAAHHQFGQNSIDLLSSYTPPLVGTNVDTTSQSYDLDQALGNVSKPGGIAVSPKYDATTGRLTSLDLPNNQSLGYQYNAVSKLDSVASSLDGVTLKLGYSGALLTSVTWQNAVAGSVAFEYDDDLSVTTETVKVGATESKAEFKYADADGLLTDAGALKLTLDKDTGALIGTAIGAVQDSIGYNEFGELKGYSVSNGGSIYKLDYLRDSLGRVTYRAEVIKGKSVVTGYGYDAAGRLTDVYDCNSVGDTFDKCKHTAHYEFDANGNRTKLEEATKKKLPKKQKKKPNPTITNVVGAYDAQDRLKSIGGASYKYTPNGELLEVTDTASDDTLISYEHDALGQLRKVAIAGGDTIEYLYDGAGHRVAKKLNGVVTKKWLYAGGTNPVAELDGVGTLKLRFVYGTKAHVPDYMVAYPGGATYRLVTDQLGSVRLVVNVADGKVAQTIAYDAWGDVVSDSAVGFQPFGFAGGLYDPDTGLVHFGARDYDPETARWLSKDPIGFGGGTTNLYGYVLGDPINIIDPSGLVSQDDLFDLADMLGVGTVGRGIALRRDAPLEVSKGNVGGAACMAAAGSAGILLGAIGLGAQAGAGVGGRGAKGAAYARRLGVAGEEAAGIVKNTRQIPSASGTANYRVPDVLNPDARLIGEVKNVGTLAYTNQLRDFVAWGQQNHFRFELITRQGTRFSGPLQDAIDSGDIILRRLLP